MSDRSSSSSSTSCNKKSNDYSRSSGGPQGVGKKREKERKRDSRSNSRERKLRSRREVSNSTKSFASQCERSAEVLTEEHTGSMGKRTHVRDNHHSSHRSLHSISSSVDRSKHRSHENREEGVKKNKVEQREERGKRSHSRSSSSSSKGYVNLTNSSHSKNSSNSSSCDRREKHQHSHSYHGESNTGSSDCVYKIHSTLRTNQRSSSSGNSTSKGGQNEAELNQEARTGSSRSWCDRSVSRTVSNARDSCKGNRTGSSTSSGKDGISSGRDRSSGSISISSKSQKDGFENRCSTRNPRLQYTSGSDKNPLTANEGRLASLKQLITEESEAAAAAENAAVTGGWEAIFEKQKEMQSFEAAQELIEDEDGTKYSDFLNRTRLENQQNSGACKFLNADRNTEAQGLTSQGGRKGLHGSAAGLKSAREISHLDAIFGGKSQILSGTAESVEQRNLTAAKAAASPKTAFCTATIPGLEGVAILADAVVMQTGNKAAGWKLRRQLQQH